MQLQIRLRHSQSLLIGSYGALSAHHFDGGESANLNLLLGVRKSLLRESQRLILHPHVFIGEHQIPVDVFDLVNGSDNLQPECDVGNFPIILGNPDKPGIGRKAEALEQVLSEPGLKPCR